MKRGYSKSLDDKDSILSTDVGDSQRRNYVKAEEAVSLFFRPLAVINRGGSRAGERSRDKGSACACMRIPRPPATIIRIPVEVHVRY